MYTNNSRTNAMRPLSSRPESQSLKNIIGLFSHASAKPQPILNELPREFGKDITNSKGLTEISNEDNIKKITVNKKNHVYIDLCGDVNMKDIKVEDVVMQEVNDRSDPQEVDEYFEDIVEYFREEDGKKRPRENYMDRQGDITYKMRAILVDWLVDVHLKYKMVPETLFLTINIIDRYLDKVNTPRTELQLVGVAAMFIASKYEDIYPPEAKEFAYITDKAFTKSQVLAMEKKILRTLEFEVTIVTPYRFLEVYKKMLRLNEETFYYAWYLIELSLVDYKMLKFKPSEVAASACLIAWKMMRNWMMEDFEEKTGYSEEQLRECSKQICVYLQEEEKGKLHAVKEKFSQTKYKQVAKNKFL